MPQDDEPSVDELLDAMNVRSDRRHLEDECLLLDDRCCIRAWQATRAHLPELVESVELLFGKDFWSGIPQPLRTLLAGFAMDAGHDPEQLRAAAKRGLIAARASLEQEKVRVIKRARTIKTAA